MKSYNIRYYSTNHKAPEVSFREALMKGLAPDGGLYMPSFIPRIDSDMLSGFKSKEYHEVAADVLNSFLENDIDNSVLRTICKDAYNFPVPVEKVTNQNYILRLDCGPTASFKDFAARIMARLMNHFLSQSDERLTILTATSGDTGSAVANAFSGLEQINVIILFPLNEVSTMQRKQMTTLRGNIRVIGLDGKFDDCQRFVKLAFLDPDLSRQKLTSANSINISRLLPQSVYYFYAWSRVQEKPGTKTVFSVPCGNFGNLMGGIIAREMGLPVEKLVIATNENNEVPEYFRSGSYAKISPSINCISNAMNVGHPSNLARVVSLYGGVMDESGNISASPDMKRMKDDFFAISITDDETRETIRDFFHKTGKFLEPHGAAAWKGMQEYHKSSPDATFIALETAHPGKFREEIVNLLGSAPSLPPEIEKLNELDEDYTILMNNYSDIKNYLLNQKQGL